MTTNLYLVNPPDKGMLSGFSGALLFLKSWVNMKAPKTNVSYIDLALSKKDGKPLEGTKQAIIDELSTYDLVPGSIYGLTATTATYQNALEAARAIKERDSKATIILGGHHAAHEADIILGLHPEIDYCATSEGERVLEDFIAGKPAEKIRGIAYRTENSIRRNFVNLLLKQELDMFQFETIDWSPVQDSLKNDLVRGQFGYFDITTARGCNLKCTFCAFGEDKLRDMSPKSKAKLLADMVNSDIYEHAQGVNIHDNDFAQNTRKTHELCDIIIESNLYINWTMQTRVEHLNNKNEELVKKLRKAGCSEVYLGVENFDPEIAKYLKHVKNIEKYLQNTQEAVINTLKHNVGCNINLQLGVPAETYEARKNNIDALLEVTKKAQTVLGKNFEGKITIYPQLSVVYPGTAMAKMPIRGTSEYLPEDAFEVFTKWEWKKEQQGLVEYLGENFAHGNGGIPLGIIEIKKFVEKGVIEIVTEKLNQVNNYLKQIHSVADKNPIIKVFNYAQYVQK